MKKIRTPQVQVKFPGSYKKECIFKKYSQVVMFKCFNYSSNFNYSPMAAIAIKHMCALSE